MKVRPPTPTWKYEYPKSSSLISNEFELTTEKFENLELYKGQAGKR